MKILNKFIWSKKEPSNKNDIWFDGSTWRMYTEEAWQSFTLPVDAADTLTKMLENASEVYQEKLNAGYGIIIEGNTISVDDSNVWEAIETLQQNKVEQIQLNDYVPLDRYSSTAQVLMDNISELNSTKLNKADVATINGQSLAEGGNIVIEENSKIILDFEKLGEPIEGDEEGMEMRYSKEQFESAVGMSMSEFIEKIKTSELVLSAGVGGMNSYYVVADEYTWTGYYKIPGLFNYVLSVDATPSEEKMFVSVYDEAADLPFARTEYVDEKHAQTETKLTELSAEIKEKSEVSLETLANGNLKVTIDGVSKDFMAATPSGDPQHYAFMAIGAKYNATANDSSVAAPWAALADDAADKVVIHKAGHWLLNGVGDLTNRDMRHILARGAAIPGVIYSMANAISDYYYTDNNPGANAVRTNYCFAGTVNFTIEMGAFFNNQVIEVIELSARPNVAQGNIQIKTMYFARLATNLRHIVGICIPNDAYADAFTGSPLLKTIDVRELKYNINFKDQPLLTNASILNMINKEKATSAIVITLHADAYARAMANTNIQSALAAHPNVSLAKA